MVTRFEFFCWFVQYLMHDPRLPAIFHMVAAKVHLPVGVFHMGAVLRERTK
jgi:hypothetical protein